MNKNDLSFLVVGADAIGGITAALLRKNGFKYRRLKSSSLQSLERGKLTEVDYFKRYIVKNAIRSGIPVPVNSAVVNLTHEIEQNKRKISVTNFSEPLFDRFND